MVTANALRVRNWRRLRRESWRQSCACCHDIFTPNRRNQIFCSAACGQRDYRRRRAAGETAARKAPGAPWRDFGAERPPTPAAKAEAGLGAAAGTRNRDGKVIDIAALVG